MRKSRAAEFWLLVLAVLCTYEQSSGASCAEGCGTLYCRDIVLVSAGIIVESCDECRCRRKGPDCKFPCFASENSTGEDSESSTDEDSESSTDEDSESSSNADSGGSTNEDSGTSGSSGNLDFGNAEGAISIPADGDGTCVESEWLERRGLLKMHSEDREAKVLCPEGLPCGTSSHILTVGGQPTTYARLCESETCQAKIARVNTFVLTVGTTVGLESPGRPDARVTPFALTGWSVVDRLQMRLARLCSEEECEHRLGVKAVRTYQALSRALNVKRES